MFALMVYDVPSDIPGTKRRNKIYKLCKKYGYHVQNSVFEFDIDYATLIKLSNDIEKVIDKSIDSIRIYKLGKERTDTNVIVLGKKELLESNDDAFIL